MGDFLIIPCLNCIKISQKQAWRPLIYFAWMKSMYFREYVCRFSRKSHYFCILGMSHLRTLTTCTSRMRVSYGLRFYYSDVIVGVMVSEITNLTFVYSTVYSGTDQRKHQSSASLAFVQGIYRWPMMQKMFPFHYVIMLVPIMIYVVFIIPRA